MSNENGISQIRKPAGHYVAQKRGSISIGYFLRIKDYSNLGGFYIAVLDSQQIKVVEDHAHQMQELMRTERRNDSH